MHVEQKETRRILEQLADGGISVDDALLALKREPFTDLGYAKVDHHRALRQGASEVIYGAGKTPEQIVGIAASLREEGAECVLITRLKDEALALLEERFGESFRFHEVARVGIVGDLQSLTETARSSSLRRGQATFTLLKRPPSPPRLSATR